MVMYFSDTVKRLLSVGSRDVIPGFQQYSCYFVVVSVSSLAGASVTTRCAKVLSSAKRVAFLVFLSVVIMFTFFCMVVSLVFCLYSMIATFKTFVNYHIFFDPTSQFWIFFLTFNRRLLAPVIIIMKLIDEQLR